MYSTFRSIGKDFFQNALFRDGFIWKLPEVPGAIALTFDDGPDEIFTPMMLDLLGRHQIKATFFLIGEKAEKSPSLVRRIVNEGHGIGNHSYRHRVITEQSRKELEIDLGRCRATLSNATGIDTRLFRPPKGKVSYRSIRSVCALGYKLVHWSKTYSDYKCDRIEHLMSQVVDHPPSKGDIVLLHDHNTFTLEVLEHVLPLWIKSGHTFCVL